MKVEEFFNRCPSQDPFDEDSLKLLNKIMSISSPMKFDDAFASEEQLDKLIEDLDKFNIVSNTSYRLLRAIQSVRAYQSNKFVFI